MSLRVILSHSIVRVIVYSQFEREPVFHVVEGFQTAFDPAIESLRLYVDVVHVIPSSHSKYTSYVLIGEDVVHAKYRVVAFWPVKLPRSALPHSACLRHVSDDVRRPIIVLEGFREKARYAVSPQVNEMGRETLTKQAIGFVAVAKYLHAPILIIFSYNVRVNLEFRHLHGGKQFFFVDMPHSLPREHAVSHKEF